MRSGLLSAGSESTNLKMRQLLTILIVLTAGASFIETCAAQQPAPPVGTKLLPAAEGLPVNIPATSAPLRDPQAPAADKDGNLYFVDQDVLLRLDAKTGILTLVAGTGETGFAGDNGPAVSAQLDNPVSVSLDPAGNIYIADAGNNRIRKVTNGVITTIAGNGAFGFGGDGGPAIGAQLNQPQSLAVDAAGNIYVADTSNNRVRKISNGVISTVAGTGEFGFSGDNGPATSAQLGHPNGLAVDAAGNLFVGDFYNNRIRKITDGVITTVVGSGMFGFSGDNGPATGAQLAAASGIALDTAGNLYIADAGNNRIRKVANGVITTVAGNGKAGFSGDDGPATAAGLTDPMAVAVDTAGNLYIADTLSSRIRKVANGKITTAAGNGTYRSSGPAGVKPN